MNQDRIFRRSSTTYYYSSLFFPPEIRNEVSILYSFVRTADDFVDQIPQDKKGFLNFKKEYLKALSKRSGNNIVDNFVELIKKYNINKKWVLEFFDAMESDIRPVKFQTLKETERYMHGSAEVIGLMLSKIMNLPHESYPYAKSLGKFMQYTNFIRDVQEDLNLSRNYLPSNDQRDFNLKSLQSKHVSNNIEGFKKFMQKQINVSRKWYQYASKGYVYIPFRMRLPIILASEMYIWTLDEIEKNPLVVYKKKIKPSKWRVLSTFTIVFIKEVFSKRK